MRNTFIRALTAKAAADSRIVLITGDLGFRVVERFAKRFPNRYFNAGIAEQDMIEVAAGLALEGYKPFVYSIASFPTLRCLEQIRNCICNPELDVTILCVGGGFAYGPLGMTHHATEDIACMRALPKMEVFSPADPVEARAVAECCFESVAPKYVRLNRGGEPALAGDDVLRELPAAGLGLVLRSPKRAVAGVETDAEANAVASDESAALENASGDGDVVFLATGALVGEAIAASELLAREGIASVVASVPVIKPLDVEAVLGLASRSRLLVSVEEHSIIGGLGSAVAECLEDARIYARESLAPVLRIGIPDMFPDVVGTQDYLRERFAMNAPAIATRVREALGASKA